MPSHNGDSQQYYVQWTSITFLSNIQLRRSFHKQATNLQKATRVHKVPQSLKDCHHTTLQIVYPPVSLECTLHRITWAIEAATIV